eukprot:748439-Hanusia_phi.AAC.8
MAQTPAGAWDMSSPSERVVIDGSRRRADMRRRIDETFRRDLYDDTLRDHCGTTNSTAAYLPVPEDKELSVILTEDKSWYKLHSPSSSVGTGRGL